MKKSINEENCTCCGNKWTSNKIVELSETVFAKAWYKPFSFDEYFRVVYRLVCKDCNISTRLIKYVKKEDFKPKCKKEVKN